MRVATVHSLYVATRAPAPNGAALSMPIQQCLKPLLLRRQWAPPGRARRQGRLRTEWSWCLLDERRGPFVGSVRAARSAPEAARARLRSAVVVGELAGGLLKPLPNP